MKPVVVSRCIYPMRVFFSLFLLLASALAGAAEESPLSMPLMFDLRERVAKPDLAPVQRIRFLTTVDFPPFNFIDQSGKLSGFHVDLAREICRELNITERCQIEAAPYKDLTSKLDKGDGEVILAGMRITPELRRTHGISRVFMKLPARFVVVKSAAAAIATPQDLLPGQTGVVKGTAHEAMLAAFFPTLKPKLFEKRVALLDALRKQEIKAAYGDGLQLSFWLESEDAAGCCATLAGPYYSTHFLGDGLAMLTRKDSPSIVAAIDSALIALARSGRLNEIYLRYFPNAL